MAKIAFYTLGCKSNQYETAKMAERAIESGHEVADFAGMSDIYVINTCTVTSNADKKSRHAIRAARKRNPKAKIIVTGCMADVAAEDIKRLNCADVILKNSEKLRFGERIQALGSRPQALGSRPQAPAPLRVRANLMIENGCEEFCSYCIVPRARGKVIRRPEDQVIGEAKDLVSSGIREIVLTGINLGAYGSGLPRVLQRLSELDGLLRIRLSSIEPQFVTEELINCVAEAPKVCNHLHIPLQSGDDGILKAMNRKYVSKEYMNLIGRIKKKIPGISLNTDVIVGFPGESEKAFNNTLKLLKKIKFSRIHAFHFSPRPGTPAAEFPDQIDPKSVRKRIDRIHKLRIGLMRDFARNAKRKPQEILVESPGEGLTESYVRVKFKGRSSLIGKLVKVKITKVEGEHVIGELKDEKSHKD